MAFLQADGTHAGIARAVVATVCVVVAVVLLGTPASAGAGMVASSAATATATKVIRLIVKSFRVVDVSAKILY